MKIRLQYDRRDLDVDIPDRVDVVSYGLNGAPKQVSLTDFVDAFNNAGGDRWLADEPPLLIVNDGHRPTPTVRVLEWLNYCDKTLLDRAPVLIACGTHTEPTSEQLQRIFGPFLGRIRPRLSWHDCNDLSSMVLVGTDRFGGDIYINRLAAKARKLMIITSVEPHYFAGFTGGRKSLFPGLTDRATIERNHNLANSLECQPLRLSGNPMAEQLLELLQLINTAGVFAIQLVVDATQQISDVFCGSLEETFKQAVEKSNRFFCNEVVEPFNLILAEVRPPLDGTLYQIQKALENCQAACADGGTVAVVAACKDGIGKRDFYDMAATWDRKNNQASDGTTRLGSHKLSRVNAMTRRINVRLFSELPDDQPRRVFYEPVHDLNALVGQCFHENDRNRLAVIYDAGHTVLKLAGAL